MPIALVDCNSFYCSCEIIFRPDLEGRPVIVLSNNDGCVVSRNSLAKKIAINMAEPFYKIKNLIEQNNVAYFSSNYPLYADISSRVMRVLSTFTPDMEVYSIDEAFLNLDGFSHINLNSYGQMIKEKVYKDIHIPVSVGIANTKVLAKVANHIAKKSPKANGVVDLCSKKFHDVALSMTRVEDIWGIGRSSAAKLSAIGIKTAKEFRDYKNDKQIIKLLTKVGMQIKNELNEIPCIPLEEFAEKKKQIISSKTFGTPVFSFEDLEESVASYITTAAEKLRKQNSKTTHLSVYVRTNPFKNVHQYYNIGSHVFDVGTSDTRKLIKAGTRILKEIYRPDTEYKKAGVMLNNILDANESQLGLFDFGDTAKDQTLMESMDYINLREGRNTLKVAACGLKNSWKMAQKFKSPCYTTRWSEILKVK